MSKLKSTPRELLVELQKCNPNATPSEIKDLMADQIRRDPDALAQMMFEDLFTDFERETGFRGGDVENARAQFEAWLKNSKN